MNHDSVRRVDDVEARLDELEEQVAVLSPRRTKARVEAADALEHRTATETVRGDEPRTLETSGVELVVRRLVRQRNDDLSAGGIGGIVRERENASTQPVRL